MKELWNKDYALKTLVAGVVVFAAGVYAPWQVLAWPVAFIGSRLLITGFDSLGWPTIVHGIRDAVLPARISDAVIVLEIHENEYAFGPGLADEVEHVYERATPPDTAKMGYRAIQIAWQVAVWYIMLAQLGPIVTALSILAWWSGSDDWLYHYVTKDQWMLPSWGDEPEFRSWDHGQRWAWVHPASYWSFGYWLFPVGLWYWWFGPRDTHDPERTGKPVPMLPAAVYTGMLAGFIVTFAATIVIPLVWRM